jgi:hypothetical protein
MPKGQGLGRPVVLLLDHGVEKPSTILGFRVQYLQLSLGALPQPNMSPAFQQSLVYGAHELCSSVQVDILDPNF